MAQKFTKGTVVCLKSGGPDMTIERYKAIISFQGPSSESQEIVECIWFDGTKKLGSDFHQDSLELAEN